MTIKVFHYRTTVSQRKRGASDNCWPLDNTNSLTGLENRTKTALEFTMTMQNKAQTWKLCGSTIQHILPLPVINLD